MGGKLSDHGLEQLYAADYTDADIRRIFDHVRAGQAVTPEEGIQFKSALLYEFGLMDAEKGWTQQFHIGALRNNNPRMFSHARGRYGLGQHRRLRAGTPAGPLSGSARRRRPALEDDSLQPQPAR
jgi:glucuronate isomerase